MIKGQVNVKNFLGLNEYMSDVKCTGRDESFVSCIIKEKIEVILGTIFLRLPVAIATGSRLKRKFFIDWSMARCFD
jgi:hypothetical protein